MGKQVSIRSLANYARYFSRQVLFGDSDELKMIEQARADMASLPKLKVFFYHHAFGKPPQMVHVDAPDSGALFPRIDFSKMSIEKIKAFQEAVSVINGIMAEQSSESSDALGDGSTGDGGDSSETGC